jgi:hypothetical protein
MPHFWGQFVVGVMYRREFVLASFSLLALAFATFLDDSTSAVLSRPIALSLITLVLGIWALVLWRFFRSTSMSRREKLAAWLTFGFLVCGLLATRVASRYVHELDWLSDLEWSAFWLSLALGFAVLVRLVAPKPAFPNTHYTVESETPDHVTTIDHA